MNLIILLFSISYIAPLILSALSIKIRSLFLSITSIFNIFSLLLSFVEKIYGVLIKLLDDGKFCHLQEPDSLNFGVNSFWLFAARESFSFYEIGKELPDHYMTSYLSNMKLCASNKTGEVLWKDRLQYISHEGMLGEFGKKKKK